MKYRKLCRPCKNLAALSLISIIDPQDGCEKTAFVSIAQGTKGMLVIADVDRKKFEAYSMQMDAGAWGLIQLPGDRSLVLGTSNYYGSIQRFDMVNRKWYEPLRIESEEYIWNLVLGSDGNVYGGTWPGDRLVQYCPDTHTLNDMGKVTAEPGNNYARMVYGDVPGKLIISSQFDVKRVTSYDIATKTFDRNYTKRPCNVFMMTSQFVCTSDDKALEFLDANTGAKLIEEEIPFKNWETFAQKYDFVKQAVALYHKDAKNRMVKRFGVGFSCVATYMSNGDMIGVQGQEMFRIKKGETEPHFVDIDCESPEAFIHEIITAADGKIWGASSFGMTIFSYDPKTGNYENTRSITTAGGEVYGMVAYNNKIYSTAYCWGEHVVYDPTKPWQGRENINPKMVKSLYPQFIRPYTRSHVDKNGFIWTGWLSDYGTRGLAISKWNTKDDTVEVFENIVAQTGIYGMAVTDNYVWFTTCNHANGLPDLDTPLSLCAIDKDGNLVFRKNFGQAENTGRVAFAGRYGVVQVGTHLYRIDDEKLEVQRVEDVELSLHNGCRLESILAYTDDTVVVFDIETAIFIKPETCEVVERVASPKGNPKELFYHGVFAATVVDGEIYATVGPDLYKIEA